MGLFVVHHLVDDLEELHQLGTNIEGTAYKVVIWMFSRVLQPAICENIPFDFGVGRFLMPLVVFFCQYREDGHHLEVVEGVCVLFVMGRDQFVEVFGQ